MSRSGNIASFGNRAEAGHSPARSDQATKLAWVETRLVKVREIGAMRIRKFSRHRKWSFTDLTSNDTDREERVALIGNVTETQIEGYIEHGDRPVTMGVGVGSPLILGRNWSRSSPEN